jgi:hypothetical protein
VRALLAKAEATKFPEEAEALSAKAQELMSRYSLHQAVADHGRGRAPVAAAQRIWIGSGYGSIVPMPGPRRCSPSYGFATQKISMSSGRPFSR